MEKDSADGETLRAALLVLAAERDRLRAKLDAAGAVNERLRGEAQAAQRAKADFMARMTHEMRTPLSAIIGLANLAMPLSGDPQSIDYLIKITASARGLLGVVDDITDFSRLEKGLADLVPVPFDLAASLARVVDRFAETAGHKGLALVARRDPRVPTRLVGDNARLEGVLSHLVGNAVKFTEKGSVTLSVALVRREGGTIRLAFAVHDTGIGMDRETIPAMLESFTQADGSLSRPYGGTGLGLALVRRGAALLGGDLSVSSLPGQGASFSFEAVFTEDTRAAGRQEGAGPSPRPPVAAAPVVPGAWTPAPAWPETGRPLSGALILLVEDNSINQQVARDTLERFGASVAVAQNGREAVEMVKLAFYDAVLMDVQMPVMDGLAATRAIRALPGGSDLPIVALTAHALAEDRDRCLEAGMNDYLTKPIDPGRLLAALGQWIAPAAAARLTIEARGEGTPVAGVGAAPGLDAATALARLGGNERLLFSVAAEFTRDYAGSAAAMARRIEAGDLGGARRLAHTIKGVAGNIAAEPLAGAARELETALTEGNIPTPAALAAFATALDATIEAASRLAPPPDAPPACAKTGCWRILLVDDAKLNRAIFSQILCNAGHDVVTAVNGKEACRALFGEKATGRPYDLILMDIEMPEMDGPAATRVIRGLLAASANPPCPPGIPIVALTSHDVAVERARCLEAGMDECLHKVFEHDALLAALDQVMQGRAPRERRSTGKRPSSGSGAGLAPLLRCLAGHLAEGSIRADEDMAVLREALAGRAALPEVEELSQAIERYEFAAALALIGRLAPLLGVEPAGVFQRAGTGFKPA